MSGYANVTNAALLAAIKTPLDTPLQIHCRKGEGNALVCAMRVKLSRERKNASHSGVTFTDFNLAIISTVEDAQDRTAEFITCVRTLSKFGRRREMKFLNELRAMTWRDRHAILDYMEKTEREHTPDMINTDDIREKKTQLWSTRNVAIFDAIIFAEGIKDDVRSSSIKTYDGRSFKKLTPEELAERFGSESSDTDSDTTFGAENLDRKYGLASTAAFFDEFAGSGQAGGTHEHVSTIHGRQEDANGDCEIRSTTDPAGSTRSVIAQTGNSKSPAKPCSFFDWKRQHGA